MSEAGPSQYSWHNNTANGNARVHNGPVHGDVTNNFYEDRKSPVARVLESLSFPEMNRYQQRPLETYPGTYEWIFDDGKVEHSCEDCAHTLHGTDCSDCWNELNYQCRNAIMYDRKVILPEGDKLRSWLRTSQDIFWISGKAGAGKSCFMKFILEFNRTAELLCEWASHDVTITGFFFWAAGGELGKTYIGLLRSLLYQIISKEPHLAEKLLTSGHHTSDITPSWSISQLSKAFQMVLADASVSTSFAFFIDGLDEFHGDVPDLLGALDNLNKSPNVKICVSSREHNVFKNKYGRRGPSLHMRLHEVTRQDVDAYIQGRLIDDLELQQSADPETSRRLHLLSTALRDKAEGVFLWVYLAVKSLRESISNAWTISEMLRLLDDIPPELEDFIQRIFDSIHSLHRRNAARTFLLMLLREEQGCTLDLLSLALLDPLSDQPFATVRGDHWSNGDRHGFRYVDLPNPLFRLVVASSLDLADQAARRWCKDLVNVHRSDIDWHEYHYIDFPHRTIRDFIQQKKQDGILADLASKDFCPAFAMCSVFLQRPYYQRQAMRPLWEHMRALRHFALTCDFVDQSKDMLLLDLARIMDAYGHSIRGNNIHWALDLHSSFDHDWTDLLHAIGLASFDMHLLDDALPGAVFAALLLHSGAHRLFWLIVDTAPDAFRTNYMQMGLAALLRRDKYIDRIWEGTYQSVGYRNVSTLLKRGADPNLMVYCTGPISPWTVFLTKLHNTFDLPSNWMELVSVLDEMLQYGADPDACLELDSLYTFIKEPARSMERSALLPGSTQRGHASKVMVPATAAFEVPHNGTSYNEDPDLDDQDSDLDDQDSDLDDQDPDLDDRWETIEKYFPIIKAKLIAASEAKARKQQIVNEERTVNQECDNSSEATTSGRMSTYPLSFDIFLL